MEQIDEMIREDIGAEEELIFDGQLGVSHVGDTEEESFDLYLNRMVDVALEGEEETEDFADPEWSEEMLRDLKGEV